MKRLFPVLVVLMALLMVIGCQSISPSSQATSTTQKGAVLRVSAIDAKTKEALPTSSWELGTLVERHTGKPPGPIREAKYELIFEPIVQGTFDATMTASAHYPGYKTITVKPGINKVQFILEPIPPQTSEDAAYRELKKSYPLPIYRPRYMPAGFVIAPYSGAEEFKKKNPDTNEGIIVYESAKG